MSEADPRASPTPTQILLADASISVFCPACRVLRAPKDLAFDLAVNGKGNVPIATLAFRCRDCGGEPWVQGRGNSLLGREQLWPPTA